MITKKKRVYVCYDIVNDAKQYDFISAQSKQPDSPFTIVDRSEKWIPPESEWMEKLKKRMSFVDFIIVMTSEKTYRSHNVLEETETAYNLGKPIIQTTGVKFGNYRSVPKAGKIIKWDWEYMKKVIK